MPDTTPLPVPSPAALRARIPGSEGLRAHVKHARRALCDVLHGRDPRRLAVVVGPCSLHDEAAALEYAARLRRVADRTRDALVVVMRAYVEKPRTALGWKGLVNDPDLDDSCDVARGLERARRLLRDLGEAGVACATEVVDPLLAPYLVDLVSWLAIGARTCESPIHRQLASGLDLPVGVKNPMDGSLEPALHALAAVSAAHAGLGLDAGGRACVVRTHGNLDRHLVLRGGRRGPNHDAAQVGEAVAGGRALGVARPVMVDCSHENSGRDHRRQAAVWREVLAQVREGQDGIAGLMLESHLEEGRQALERDGRPPRPGRSLTDACIGWDETETLLLEAAATVRAGRVPAAAGPPGALVESPRGRAEAGSIPPRRQPMSTPAACVGADPQRSP